MNIAQNAAQKIMSFDMDGMDDAAQVTHKVTVIEDAEGEPVSGFVIVGKDSDEYRKAYNGVRVNNVKRGAKRVKPLDTSTDEGAQQLVDTVAKNDKVLVSAVVVGWFGFSKKGVLQEFDKAVADKMLDRFPTWSQKVSAALENEANFTKV